MLKKVALGISDFKEVMEENVYFVDKTLLIKDFMDYESDIVVLPRPRRFGKTLNMSMLKYFLDNKESSKELFEGLEIAKDKEFCEKHMNKHPLIYRIKRSEERYMERIFQIVKKYYSKRV